MTASALLVSPQGRLRAGWRAALFVVLLVVLTAIGDVESVVATALGAGPAFEAIRPYLYYLQLIAAALVAHWVMLRFVDRQPWGYAGLARADAGLSRLTAGFVLGAVAIGLPCLLLIVVGWLSVNAEPHLPGLARETTAALALLIPAALLEELMMRGYLLSALADGIGRWWALVVTSVVFALLHVRNPGMTPQALAVVALAGVFLGAVRYATASLYAAWAAHFAWNAMLGVALHALVSGQAIARSGWQTLDSGPDWATGGAWGPEGGVVAALGLALATTFLVVRRPRALDAHNVSAHTHA